MTLELRPSRVLRAWWCVLHLLLAVAGGLVGWPVPIKALAIAAALGHGLLRWPRASPRLVIVSAGGSCSVPEWQVGPTTLGERTLVCPFWIRLEVRAGAGRRDIVLLADQVRPEDWRRLRAILGRARCV